MKKSTKSLFSITVSFLFVFSMAAQILNFGFTPSDNQIYETTRDILPSSAYNTQDGIQPLELKDDLKNDLGFIEIEGLSVRAEIPANSFYESDSDNIQYDHSVEAINPKFDSTLLAASAERSSGTTANRNSTVRILLNESVKWTYTSDSESYIVGFAPYMQKATFSRMYMNGTLVNSTQYFTSSEFIGGKFINRFNYNFTDLFEANNDGEFILLYQYTVDIPISRWQVNTVFDATQTEEGDIILEDEYQYITGMQTQMSLPYSYNVTFGDQDWDYNVSARFKITFPDPEYIYDTELVEYSDAVIDDLPYSLINNTVSLNFWTELEQKRQLDAKFQADFTVEILESIDGEQFWCEDRLVSGINTRQRDYKITVSDGPPNLLLMFFGMNDTSIYYDELLDENEITSALNRYTAVENMNVSTGDPSGTVVSGNTTLEFVDGISMLITPETHLFPYILCRGEVDIITVNYEASHDLNLVITDNTKTPISGVRVNVYFRDHLYGAKMNNFNVLPYPQKSSNSNGKIFIPGAPIGDYMIEILDSQGNSFQNLTASSLEDVNILVTNIPHFPATILVFAGISAVLIISGLIIYKKKE